MPTMRSCPACGNRSFSDLPLAEESDPSGSASSEQNKGQLPQHEDGMSPKEAAEILGGGSDYIAKQINIARSVLLGE